MLLKYLPLVLLAGRSVSGATLPGDCCYKDLTPVSLDCDASPDPNVDICECPLKIELVVSSCDPKPTDRIVLYNDDDFAQAVTYLYICGGVAPCDSDEEPPTSTVITIDRNTFTPIEDGLLEYPFGDVDDNFVPIYEVFDEDDRTYTGTGEGDSFVWEPYIAQQYEAYVYLTLTDCYKYEGTWGNELKTTCDDGFVDGKYGSGCECTVARDWWDNNFFDCPDATKKKAVGCPTECFEECAACLEYIGCDHVTLP